MALFDDIQTWLQPALNTDTGNTLEFQRLTLGAKNKSDVDISLTFIPSRGPEYHVGSETYNTPIDGSTNDGGVTWEYAGCMFEARGREPGLNDDVNEYNTKAYEALRRVYKRMMNLRVGSNTVGNTEFILADAPNSTPYPLKQLPNKQLIFAITIEIAYREV